MQKLYKTHITGPNEVRAIGSYLIFRKEQFCRLTACLLAVLSLLAIEPMTICAAGSHLDYSFITNGRVMTNIGGSDFATAVAIQTDGKIVVAGQADGNGTDFAVVRYNTNGLLDTSFNGTGKVVSDFVGGADGASAVAIQPDGKIVVVGHATINNSTFFAVIRYNSNGSLDTTLNVTGKVFITFGGTVEWCTSVAIQTDGKIIISGYSGSGGDNIWATARLTTSGVLDSTFGTNGKVTTTFGGSSNAVGVVIQPGGKIVVGGRTSTTGTSKLALARYASNGSLDTTFGNGGVVLSDFGNSNNNVTALKMMTDGRLVLAGNTTINTPHIALARFTINGALDTTFGTGGKVTSAAGVASDLAIYPNGDIAVTVAELDFTINIFDVYRFLSNGSLDPSFGTGGHVHSGSIATVYGVALQSNGRIVATGEYGSDFLTIRYNNISTAANADFTQDGRADFTVWRPSNGTWYEANSVTGANGNIVWGLAGDIPVPGDYDRDGKTDVAVFRPSNGTWYIIRSSDGGTVTTQFGLNGDKPVAGDYDGDGITDIAVWRPSNGVWYQQRSTSGFTALVYGLSTDIPVPGDYDGDGLTDVGVFRPSSGVWYLHESFDETRTFGQNGDTPVAGDYDGDGKCDIALWRPSTGVWYYQKSSDFSYKAITWGSNGDIPVPVDFDGDGAVDFTVFRPSNGIWYIVQSSNGGFRGFTWGANGDVPIL